MFQKLGIGYFTVVVDVRAKVSPNKKSLLKYLLMADKPNYAELFGLGVRSDYA